MSHVTYGWICINSDVNRLVSSQFTPDLLCVLTQKSHMLHTKEPCSTHQRTLLSCDKTCSYNELFCNGCEVCVCAYIFFIERDVVLRL